mgnify:CR=1 FL=1
MELQTFIHSNPDFISILKKNNFKVQAFKDLKIISHPYEKQLTFTNDSDYWKMFCRGAVINSENKIICLPPVKAIELTDKDYIPEGPLSRVYEHLVDGTMVNLFYHKDEWIISTRSEIGGYNKWNNKKSFRTLFDECSTIDYDTLDKDCSYSFVMRHTENRNVSPVKQNDIILVEVYRYNDTEIQRLSKSDYPTNNYTLIERNHPECQERGQFMKHYSDPVIPYYRKGFTIKCGSMRYKWINPYFHEIKNLKMNTNNHCLNYIELRRNGNLKKYLRYFPEHQHLFDNYREKIHSLSNDLFTNYKNTFIYKSMDKKDIPYYLKPLVHDIHKIYLKTKQPTQWTDIKQYIHSIPSKKLQFALNYC